MCSSGVPRLELESLFNADTEDPTDMDFRPAADRTLSDFDPFLDVLFAPSADVRKATHYFFITA